MTNLTPGIKSLRKIQLGAEATAGTKINPTVLWRGEGTLKNDLLIVNPVEDIGIVIDTDRAYLPSKGGTLTLDTTPATFEQLPYLGEMGIKLLGTGVADGAGTGKIYAYPLPTTTKNTIRTYSAEAGDDRQAEFVQYSFAQNIKLSGKYNEAVMMGATIKTRAVAPNTYTSATISSTSTITIKDSAALFTFSTGTNITISGSTAADGTYAVSVASTASLTISPAIATFSTGSTITIEQTFTTVAVPAIEEIMFNMGKLYIDAVSGTIGTTQKSNTFLSFDLDLNTGWKGQPTGDGRLDFSFAKVTKPTWTLKITYEHDGTATAEKAAWIAKTPRLVRLKFEGAALVTAGTTYTYKTLIIDVPGIYTDFSALENDDGNDTVTCTLKGGYDSTAALGGQIVVVNSLTALT